MSMWGGEVAGLGSLRKPRAAFKSDPGPVLFTMLCFLLVPVVRVAVVFKCPLSLSQYPGHAFG